MESIRLEKTGRDLTVFAGKYMYSRRDPSRRPDVIAESAPVESHSLYLIPSPLLGYGIRKFLERIPEDSHVLAIEASEEAMALCTPHIPKDLIHHPQLSWVRISEEQTLYSLFQQLGPWNFRKILRLDLSAGASMHAEIYNRLHTFLDENLAAYWRSRATINRMGREWIRHFIANLAAISTGKIQVHSPLNLKVKGTPVVIGAGPSLDKVIPFLKKNRKNLWLMATDTALGTLLKTDIQPDVVVVLETQPWNYLDFHGTKNSEISILADMTAYPPSLTHTDGDCYIFSSFFAQLDFLDRVENASLLPLQIPPLGSVGLTAIELALRLNSGPVLLAGLDFSYRHGKTHARGTSVHQWELTSIHRLRPSIGWKGTVLRSHRNIKGEEGMLITNSILIEHATLLKAMNQKHKRIHILHPGGMSPEVPIINFEQAEELIQKTLSHSLSTSSTIPPHYKSLAKKFLKEERTKLQAIIDVWNKYSEKKATGEMVVTALAKMDEIFCDFPDHPPLPRKNQVFLTRAVKRTRELLKYMERLTFNESEPS